MGNAATFTKPAGAPDDAASETAEPRNIRRDIQGLTLAAVTLMLLVSVVTRDPADPITAPSWPLRTLYTPAPTHYPTHEAITNACGYWGAYVSSLLIDAVGISIAVIIAALGATAVGILTRERFNAPVVRSLGCTIVVAAVSTAACLTPLTIDGFPTVGAGGYLGAMGSLFLKSHFALPGAWILTLTVLAIGVLLTTDYALWYAGLKVFSCGAMVSRRGFESVHDRLPGVARRQRKAVTDLDDPLPTTDDLAPATDLAGDATGNLADGSDSGEQRPVVKLRSRPKAAAHESPEPSQRPGAAASGNLADAAAAAQTARAAHQPASTRAETVETDAADRAWDGDDSTAAIGDEVAAGGEDQPEPTAAGPAPRIRVPKKREELQAVIDTVNEDLPDGVGEYHLPGLELLDEADDICYEDQTAEVMRKAKVLEDTFRNFGFNIRVVEIETGPVIAQYEVELEAGLRLSKITGLADDLAIALRVPSVRIVAPIPGKNTVGIEVPNEKRQVVTLREVIEEGANTTKKMNIPVFLGKDVSGNPLTIDLAKMPHLLIAGRTGTGKSVCLNAIITSVLMTCRPSEVRMLMIDPKMVELSGYGRLPHLMHPVVTDMKKAEAILAWAVEKMEERYALLAKAGVRHINSYNDLGQEELYRRLEIDESDSGQGVPEKLPFIVIVADEMADLMMTAGKEVETHIIRLAQKSRAVGIHLILATQKPTVDVITGLIKSNLPARLSFQVASRTDSRVVLDENGADKLLGNGDMLFLWPGTSTLIRGQGTYLSDDEIDRVVAHCSTGEQNFVGELMNLKVDSEAGGGPELIAANLKKRDELYESAIEVVVREGRGSVSLLQRCLGIGYGRAARLIDYMAEDGIVGQYNGSQARDVILTMADWERMQGLPPSGPDDDDGTDHSSEL